MANGDWVENHRLTFDPAPPESYAFCSDTAFKPDLAALVKGVNCLYHEATFLALHQDLAEKTKHSTPAEAAQIAAKAEVKQLILGHFSSRYPDLTPLLLKPKSIFKMFT